MKVCVCSQMETRDKLLTLYMQKRQISLRTLVNRLSLCQLSLLLRRQLMVDQRLHRDFHNHLIRMMMRAGTQGQCGQL